MANNSNSILIKDSRGQFKTVSLGVAGKNHLDGVSAGIGRMSDGGKLNTLKHENIPTGGGSAFGGKTLKQKEDKAEEKMPSLVAKEVAMPFFYFHLEDEEEAARFKDKEQILKLFQKQKNLVYLIDEVVKIIKEKGLELSEPAVRRLKRVIDSRWCEVRDLMETKEALVRGKELGGVGLDNEQAQEVLRVIETKRIEFQDGWEDIEALKHENISARGGSSPAVPHLLETEEQEKISEIEPVKERIMAKVKPVSTYVHPSYEKSVRDEETEFEPVKTRIPGQVMTTSQEIVPPAVKKELVFKPPLSAPAPAMRWTRPATWPKLTGPVEELGSFDLASFRALGGASSAESVVKIKNKIELLQDESYAKRAEGIRAWRSSPIYQSYLSLGQESIEKNQPMAAVIQEKQRRGELCLTIEEFEAVADLNKELSY